MRKPRVVSDWKRSWRWLSMQIGAVCVLYGQLSPDQQLATLQTVGLRPDQLPAVIGAAFMVGRLLQQEQK